MAVTHDRYFLDNVAGWILELDRGQGIPFEGNYSEWLKAKAKRLEVHQPLSCVCQPSSCVLLAFILCSVAFILLRYISLALATHSAGAHVCTGALAAVTDQRQVALIQAKALMLWCVLHGPSAA